MKLADLDTPIIDLPCLISLKKTNVRGVGYTKCERYIHAWLSQVFYGDDIGETLGYRRLIEILNNSGSDFAQKGPPELRPKYCGMCHDIPAPIFVEVGRNTLCPSPEHCRDSSGNPHCVHEHTAVVNRFHEIMLYLLHVGGNIDEDSFVSYAAWMRLVGSIKYACDRFLVTSIGCRDLHGKTIDFPLYERESPLQDWLKKRNQHVQSMLYPRFGQTLASARERILLGINGNICLNTKVDDQKIASRIVDLATVQYHQNFWTMEPPVLSLPCS